MTGPTESLTISENCADEVRLVLIDTFSNMLRSGYSHVQSTRNLPKAPTAAAKETVTGERHRSIVQERASHATTAAPVKKPPRAPPRMSSGQLRSLATGTEIGERINWTKPAPTKSQGSCSRSNTSRPTLLPPPKSAMPSNAPPQRRKRRVPRPPTTLREKPVDSFLFKAPWPLEPKPTRRHPTRSTSRHRRCDRVDKIPSSSRVAINC